MVPCYAATCLLIGLLLQQILALYAMHHTHKLNNLHAPSIYVIPY